jgi:hypothetical protein
MITYSVYFRTDRNYAYHDIKADTPEQALALARQLRESGDIYHEASFDRYDGHAPINEIEVCHEDDEGLAVWQDDDLLLRLAAPDLLAAAQKILDRWQNGDIGETIHELAIAVEAAREGVA